MRTIPTKVFSSAKYWSKSVKPLPVFLGFAVLLTGYLAISTKTHSASSQEFSKETLLIPMRDGVDLAANMYRTMQITGAGPVLLLRTPYNKERFELQAKRFAAAGYVTLVQDCRGKYGSGGTFALYNNEGQDGYDTIEWIRKQPWSNGRVGMWGFSYMGSSQWLAAGEGAPLAVLAPGAAATNLYYNQYLGGASHLVVGARGGIGAGLWGPPPELASSPEWPKWFMHLPLSGFDKVVGHPMPWFISHVLHNKHDAFWKRTDVSKEIEHMDFPAQHLSGYYDYFCREVVRNFQAMRERSATLHSRRNQQLILGPWDHGPLKSRVGDVDFGAQAETDIIAENLSWFNRFLKPAPASNIPFAPVRYFSMGDNVWHEDTQWPPAEARATAFYLHSGGRADTRAGNGRLDRDSPQTTEPPDVFKADPADPVPAVPAHGKEYSGNFGPVDQRLAADRPDVLVYSSPPLMQPLTFAGPLRAVLYVSADTPDADWVVKLIDVHGDGFAQPLATGIQRGSFRDSEVHPSPLEPGKIYVLNIDLGHAAARIERGHSLRVQIAGSCFPLYDRNTNTAEGPTGSRTLISSEQVWHTRDRSSRVLLPLIEGK